MGAGAEGENARGAPLLALEGPSALRAVVGRRASQKPPKSRWRRSP